MTCKDKIGVIDAAAEDLLEYERAASTISEMNVPQFLRDDQPNTHILICFFDGTGNDGENPDMGCQTSVYRIYREIMGGVGGRNRSTLLYLRGPGTQENAPIKKGRDSLDGYTFSRRVETMYRNLIEAVKRIVGKRGQSADSRKCEFRIIVMGFSRGAEQAAYFSRLVHERGIQDFIGAKYSTDRFFELVLCVRFTNKPVVKPATLPQAAVLLDPVPYGRPQDFDRRLPSSVISALQIRARDERRNAFVDSRHLLHGFSFEDRCLHLTLAGAHSDIGDAYFCRGLGVRVSNIVRRYFNGLMNLSFGCLALEEEADFGDPTNVIHCSEQHQAGLHMTTKFGKNGRKEFKRLMPGRCCSVDFDCQCCLRIPIDEDLAKTLVWHKVR